MRHSVYLCGLLAVLWLGACSDSGARQTLEAENAALSTEINIIRTTATFQRDVLQITAENAERVLTQVVRQNQAISATLQATGVNATAIALVKPDGTVAATPTASSSNFNQNPATTPEVISGTLVGTAFVPTETPGQATLYNVVMAEGVGDNDCALAAVTSFSSSAEAIYVVATAANITPGTLLGAQWLREGVPLTSQDFTPDFEINQNCIWFFVDQTDFAFTPGNYSVQLLINNSPVGAPTAFAVNG